jgi:HAD superfamily hydrolase (TIGR01549 family)
MLQQPNRIRGIIFDLDGTLYVAPDFADTIQNAACSYISSLKRIAADQACNILAAARNTLKGETGEVPTLSAICTRLGGNVQDLHAFFTEALKPEAYLVRDDRVVALLERIEQSIPLYLFTNNNRVLTTRIIHILGLNELFRHIYTIDDTWHGKPDEAMLDRILAEAGLTPSEALFVGDRYDVDLRLPEQRGCPVYLSQSIEQLLRLEELLKTPDIRHHFCTR